MAKTAKTTKTTKPTSSPKSGGGFTPTSTLRENARKNVDQGAITQSYSADRKVIIEKLNEALATEWVCVLRYYRHYFMADGMLSDAVKAEFLEHAQQEQAHANKIAERIVQLGGEPDLNPDTLTNRSHAEYKPGKDLRDMVKEDLIAERIAIDSYRELIDYVGDQDTTTKRMLMEILAQEEEHADDMADMLNGWIGK
ncbi:MAG: ferritin-like domain-containing protein [Thermomonas sp.]